MADAKRLSATGSDAEVYLSASEDDTPQQEVTPELLTALVKQVEFYFSDANLPTDKKLLKQIRKDPEGYVPVKLFANFRKVRALSKDVGVITESLRDSTLLQLSSDAKRVKRIVPVPEYDIADIQRRTIVVENLPGNPSPTIESVTEVFRMYGRVKLVRICSRESKGKLPSWLTSSCQSMAGQQHAYVEFEEEEGAVLAAAALAAEGDVSDGTVQVRRLLNCIAEHRERRSNAGGGSSYGGSSIGMGGSRKGSRDVSPLGSRSGGSRRNSNGGGSFTCGSNGGAGLWGSASSGGANADTFFPHQPYHHHSYGGAFEHNAGSRRGSSGGCMPPLPPSQPPPPPRRSCDSAPPSEMAPSAANTSAVVPSAPSTRLHVYRPPAKRASDGYTFPSSGGAPMLQRSCGGSFNSASSSGGGAAPCAPASPVLMPPPPPPPRAATSTSIAATSPPLPTRAVSAGGCKPPTHPPAALATSALAEAIAAAQAERRASEAGVKAAAPLLDGPPNPVAAVAAALAPSGRTAPKFCLDLPVRGRSAAGAPPAVESSISSPRQATTTGGAKHGAVAASAGPVAAPMTAGAVPRNAQMVANVEDFINNILSRPASRPSPSAHALAAAAARKADAAVAAATSKPPQRQAEPVDAAATVAGILASALRRPVPAAIAPQSAAPKAAPAVTDAPAGARGVPNDVTAPVSATPPIAVTAVSSSTVSSVASSAASSPRESADVSSRFATQARGARTQQPQQLQPAGKRVTRREYAQWAAATPEFRAEAVSKYGATAEIAVVATGGVARCSAGGIASASASPLSYGGAVPSSISDGGAASPSPMSAPHTHTVHVARGPDGSRGFTGRRALAN